MIEETSIHTLWNLRAAIFAYAEICLQSFHLTVYRRYMFGNADTDGQIACFSLIKIIFFYGH